MEDKRTSAIQHTHTGYCNRQAQFMPASNIHCTIWSKRN